MGPHGLGSAPSEPGRRSVEADTFSLKDKDGKIRAAWFVNEHGDPRFDLAGKDGHTRLSMHLSGDTPEVVFYESTGHARLALHVNKDGLPMIRLMDTNQSGGMTLGQYNDLGTSLRIDDVAAKNRVLLGTLPPQGSPAFRLTGVNEKVQAVLQVAEPDHPVMALSGKDGGHQVICVIDKGVTPGVLLFKPGGIPVFHAP
jgi:hypothetical protein